MSERLQPYYPSIGALYELDVPRQTPVLLNDVNKLLRPGVRPEDLDVALQILIGTTFATESALCVNSDDLEIPMVDITEDMLANADPNTTAIVFPGEGAKAVLRESLNGVDFLEDGLLGPFQQFFLPTSRVVDNGRVIGVTVDVPDDTQEVFAKGQIKQVVVVDDVIATGTTLNTLRDAVQDYSPNPLTFTSCAWFVRKPTDVVGYGVVRGIYKYWCNEGFPALNSLSTWLRTDEKGFIVRENYKKKYIRYPYGFDKQIDIIRNLTTIGEYYE